MLRLINVFIIALCFLSLVSCTDEDKGGNETLRSRADALNREAKKSGYSPSDSLMNEFRKLNIELERPESELPDTRKLLHYYVFGVCHQNLDRLDSAIFYYRKACDFGTEPLGAVERRPFVRLWQLYVNNQQYSAALSFAEEFRGFIDEEKDFGLMAEYHRWKSNIYSKSGDFEKALFHNNARIELSKKTNISSNVVSALLDRVHLQNALNHKDSALYLLEEVYGNQEGLAPRYRRRITSEYATFLVEEGKYRESIPFYEESLVHAKREKKPYDRLNESFNNYSNLSSILIRLGKLTLAQKYLDSAKLLGLENVRYENTKSYWRNRLRLNSIAGKERIENDLDSLYAFHERLTSSQVDDQLEAFEAVRKSERDLLELEKKNEIDRIQRNNRTYFAIGLLLFLGLLGYYVYRQRKAKYELETLQMQQRLLRSQMNPHFTFNILYAIQNILKKDPAVADDYLMKFSRLLRLILENSMDNYVTLEREIESLNKYLELQLLRFPEKFTYQFVFDGLEEDEDLIKVPPMMLQPFIENSIEHGFKGIDYKGEIRIHLVLKDKFIECQIEDNGVGMGEKESAHKKSASVGLISRFLERSTKRSLEISSSVGSFASGNGVKINFRIPFKLVAHG